MKAAIFTGKPELEIQEVETPEPSEGQVLIRIVACGVCHTDEGYIEGTPTFKNLPLILGHEPSGYVEEVGAGVKKFEKGDAVLIPPVITCGTCKYCLKGRETICLNQKMLGNHIDGAFAEYIAIDAKDIIKIPSGLDVKDVAIVSDAVATPYHAVYGRAKVKPADKVVIVGCGGVGINVVQFTTLIGAEVVAVDLQDDKLELAKKFGAKYVINPSKEDFLTRIKETIGKADIAFEVVGNPTTQEMAFNSLGPGGKLIAVGYSPKRWDGFNSGKVMFREMEVIGSLGCPPRKFPEILYLLKEGKITLEGLITDRFTLDQINEAFDKLREGTAIRIVIDIE